MCSSTQYSKIGKIVQCSARTLTITGGYKTTESLLFSAQREKCLLCKKIICILPRDLLYYISSRYKGNQQNMCGRSSAG